MCFWPTILLFLAELDLHFCRRLYYFFKIALGPQLTHSFYSPWLSACSVETHSYKHAL